jgi:hypothetical protein
MRAAQTGNGKSGKACSASATTFYARSEAGELTLILHMSWTRIAAAMVLTGVLCVWFEVVSLGQSQKTSPPQNSTVRPVGTVQAINGNAISVRTELGPEVTVLVQETTRILRIAPGQKDLKNATPMQLQDLQVGDRMMVRGSISEDAKSVLASSLLVMKKGDIQERQEHEREDWQKRGVGGLVNAVDVSSGTITLSTAASGSSKTLTVRVPKDAIVRRYAAGSVRFEDARLGTLDQIKPGDQLCARGSRSADGSELTAEEIVSGSFRNIAGTVISAAPDENAVRIMDVLSKKPVTVKITADSQLKKLSPMLAQRIAARMKGASADTGQAPQAAIANHRSMAQEPRQGDSGSSRSHGTADLQHILGRLPKVTMGDLQKGDAVMLVTTQGSDDSALNVVTLLTGVEPILTAAPNGQAAMLLSPWNLGSPAGEAATE